MLGHIILLKSAMTRPGDLWAANGSTSAAMPSTAATTAKRMVALPVKTKD